MRTVLIPLLIALGPLPARAQVAVEADFLRRLNGQLAEVGSNPVRTQDAAAARFAEAVRVTLEAMSDGNEAGSQVAGVIRDRKIAVRGEAQKAGVAYRREAGGEVITLRDSLPAYPRVLAPYIAREAAAMLVADMPESAEKRYMRRSLEVRTWLELGGDPKALPVIEPLNGHKDEALAAEFKVWLDNGAELALEKMGQATGTENLMVLIGKREGELGTHFFTPEARREKRDELRRLQAANRRFVDFLIQENEWRRAHAHLLGA